MFYFFVSLAGLVIILIAFCYRLLSRYSEREYISRSRNNYTATWEGYPGVKVESVAGITNRSRRIILPAGALNIIVNCCCRGKTNNKFTLIHGRMKGGVQTVVAVINGCSSVVEKLRYTVSNADTTDDTTDSFVYSSSGGIFSDSMHIHFSLDN